MARKATSRPANATVHELLDVMRYTKGDRRLREALRVALSNLRSAERARRNEDKSRVSRIRLKFSMSNDEYESWEKLRKTAIALVNGAGRLRAAGDTGNQG